MFHLILRQMWLIDGEQDLEDEMPMMMARTGVMPVRQGREADNPQILPQLQSPNRNVLWYDPLWVKGLWRSVQARRAWHGGGA